jgi:hypothetical protein
MRSLASQPAIAGSMKGRESFTSTFGTDPNAGE